MMSSDGEEAADSDMMVFCASCGKAEVDDVKLKMCTACKLVKYCSVECQKNHRPQHKKACRKRAAEIRDDRLFTQPDGSYLGECPICLLPLPLDLRKSSISSCCSKIICNGCEYANVLRAREEGLEYKCSFCREPFPEMQEERGKNERIRVEANDPVAICGFGKQRYSEGDYEGAFEYWTKAAAFGDAESHFSLAGLYYEGKGVEMDEKKAMYHSEEAAIGGHPGSRYVLGLSEGESGRFDRATKHLIIAANQGLDEALEKVKDYFIKGIVSKEDYEAALRGHQAAVDETKSEQRDAVEDFAAKKSICKHNTGRW